MRSLSAAILGLAGCVSLPPAIECVDEDGDGYPSCNAPRVDCDDRDDTRHPGALELCGDDVSQDCDDDDADLACVDAVGNTVTDDGAQVFVSNRHVALHFERGGAGADSGLTGLRGEGGNGPELLTVDTRLPDRRSGVMRWPDVFAYQTILPALEVPPVNAPAVTRVAFDWGDAGVGGRSEYAIYPDGRVHRHDDVHVATTDPGSEYLLSYASLNAAELDLIDWQDNPLPPIGLPSTETLVFHHPAMGTPTDFVCALSKGGDGLGLAARGDGDGLAVTEIVRPNAPDVRMLGLSFDWIENRIVPAGSYTADLMLQIGRSPASGQPCAGFAPFADAHLTPGRPMVAQPGTLAPDAGADGYLERVGAYAISAAGAARLSITLTEATPSLALRLEDVPAYDPVIVRDGAVLIHGHDYVLQRDGALRWAVFVFASPPPAGTTFVFEWP